MVSPDTSAVILSFVFVFVFVFVSAIVFRYAVLSMFEMSGATLYLLFALAPLLFVMVLVLLWVKASENKSIAINVKMPRAERTIGTVFRDGIRMNRCNGCSCCEFRRTTTAACTMLVERRLITAFSISML
jgi:hypothetical protein